MTTVQHLHLGPDAQPIDQGRSTHGRWRTAFHPAAPVPDQPAPWPSAFHLVSDPERLTFALTEGAAAELLAPQVAEFLWKNDTVTDDWPVNLRTWLAEPDRWAEAPTGPTAFICGRLERDVAGGRLYLAWLGMNGVRLLDRHGVSLELDTHLSEGEQWTPKHGPEPVGMGLHAYRGGLFGLDRLLVYSTGAAPLGPELPDLAGAAAQHALEDWAEGAFSHLAFFDLRLSPVLTEPQHTTVNYRWINAETCLIFWQPSPNATGYRIEEAATPTFENPSLVAELTDSRQIQYRLTPPVSGPAYYRVTPLNQSVPGVPSAPFCPTPITLAAPIMESIEWAPSGGYILRWTEIPQATSYEVQVSMSSDFDAHNSMIIFRGEMPELHLPGDNPPNQFYRVRAINALYAPQMPSAWSAARRSPTRLARPIFTEVTPKRLTWEAIPGARQYLIEVSDPTEPGAEPEIITTQQTVCLPAEQPAAYRVRAVRHPDDLRTASEWSETITLTPQAGRPSPLDARFAVPVLVVGTIVALLLGVALGLLGLSAYQDANATQTPTPFPESDLRATQQAATAAIGYATQARIQGTRAAQNFAENRALAATSTAIARANNALDATNVALGGIMEVTRIAELTRTHIPSATPTITLTPSITPNLSETLDSAFAAGLTATAAQWTATPTPTFTFTPSITPNLTETIDAAFVAGLTATAAQWTATPTPTATVTPSNTPNPTLTFEAAFAAGLTATAAQWTATPTPTATVTPSNTPNLTLTFDAAFVARLTATATQWTATPTATATATPNAAATAHAAQIAALAPGCFLVALPDEPPNLMLYPRQDSPRLTTPAALWSQVFERRDTADGLWLRVQLNPTSPFRAWLRLPDGQTLAEWVGGSSCDPDRDIPATS